MTHHLKEGLEPLPDRLKNLTIDARGYPVPWFVDWITGPDGQRVPEFRAMDGRKWRDAIRLRLCWVCGQPLGRWLAFPIGPMCAINRVTAEPPSHRECAEYSIRNCPFLSEPRMVRREEGMPETAHAIGGLAILRNPGVACLWITRTYQVIADGRGGYVLTIGEPADVTWWREKRRATRAEVEASIDSGMPSLLAAARVDGPFAVQELGKQAEHAKRLYPAA